MNNGSRFAGLLGGLFPILAVVVFSVILTFTGRSAAPDPALAGQNAPASQAAAQSGGNTAGGGNSSAMTGTGMSGTGATPATTASTQTATPAATGNAAPATGGAASGTAATGNTAATPAATTPPAAGTAIQASADGEKVYTSNCASCHGPAGAGVPGAFPPLAGNKAILGSDKYVSDVLLYGLQGQINASGQNYNGVMPAWAATLSDAEIAAVLTHIRSTWGNSAPAVKADTVKTERATPLTVQQVLAERPQ
jgi:mono/diheme cytochrome c family protein